LKILIITPYHMQPPAPRILKEIEILKEKYEVEIIYPPKNLGVFQRNMFLFKKVREIKNSYDKFIVYDLLTLFFIVFLIDKNKLIYEVLDSFPEYYSYKFIKNSILKKIMEVVLEKIEYILSKYFVKAIIANSFILSKRLEKYNSKTYFIPYTSPFEAFEFYNNPDKPLAFLYIGLFNKEKGADEILKLAQVYKDYKFFIIGDIKYDIDKNLKNIVIKDRMDFQKLFDYINNLSNNYFLVGFSLIKSINKSYAIQEANKDIDYLSLGIPIIGNKREATYNKIKEGAGILIDKFNINLSNKEKKELSLKSHKIYNKLYSNKFFKNNLLKVVNC